jgi:hypothetical protein
MGVQKNKTGGANTAAAGEKIRNCTPISNTGHRDKEVS